MSDFINNISQFIQSQFPRHYREGINGDITETQRAVIVDFMEAYYEWAESNSDESFIRNRQMFEFADIDDTLDEFVKYFRNAYLKDISYETVADDRFVIKHILDLYQSKGSPASVKLLMRLLYNADATVYFPGKDILRASDSRWINPIYVEVISSDRSVGYVGKSVFGSISGATAFVEAVVTKRTGNRLIDIVYLSDVVGTFVFGDIITDDGVLSGAPKVIGSLSGVTIDQNNIGGNAVGDLFEIEAEFGQGAVARVTALVNQSGGVDFSINDGGYGYTLTSATQVLISDTVIITDNSNTIYENSTQVSQKLEKIYLDPDFSTDFVTALSLGDSISGLDATSNSVANATVMEIDTETVDNIVTPYIILQTGDNTFLKSQTITFTADVSYGVGRVLREGNDVTLDITSVSGAFENGEIVFQREFLAATSNTVSSTYNFGEVVSSNSSTIVLTNVFGEFIDTLDVTGRTSGATADVLSANVTFEGTTGTVSSKVANNQYIVTVSTEFTGSNKVIGTESKVIAEIANLEVDSIVTVDANGEQANVQFVANVYFTGTVIGQNTTNIGIATTSVNDFIYIANTSLLTDGTTELTVQEITTGSGASFEIGTLSNEETISLKTERIVDTNIFGVQYKDIFVNGQGSGIGYVNGVNVINGGTGYTNTSVVTFTGGGFGNQNPLIPAQATVTTDGSGVITSFTITEIGEGYFTVPQVSVADGSSANLQADMVFSYGFTSSPLANSNTIISEALETTNTTIGTIATLKNNRPGRNYTGRPYVTVTNPRISIFRKQDQIAEITLNTGVFLVGETVTQANTDARGLVTSANSSVINIRNLSFAEDFIVTTEGGVITGATSGAEADINNLTYNTTNNFMGDNAIINNFVTEAQGVIASVDIVDSGLGYVNGEAVTLVKGDITLTGTANVALQGVAPGYWKTRTSHLSSEKKLQDNDYWQEFSYDIQSPVNFNEYKDIVLNTLHMSGTRLFGSVVKANEEQVTVDTESSITQS